MHIQTDYSRELKPAKAIPPETEWLIVPYGADVYHSGDRLWLGQESVIRLDFSLPIYWLGIHCGKKPAYFLSAGKPLRGWYKTDPTLAKLMGEYLILRGVKESEIIYGNEVWGTNGETAQSLHTVAWNEESGVKLEEVFAVSSDYHLRRIRRAWKVGKLLLKVAGHSVTPRIHYEGVSYHNFRNQVLELPKRLVDLMIQMDEFQTYFFPPSRVRIVDRALDY